MQYARDTSFLLDYHIFSFKINVNKFIRLNLLFLQFSIFKITQDPKTLPYFIITEKSIQFFKLHRILKQHLDKLMIDKVFNFLNYTGS